jgi:precorrin-2 methylase
MSNESARTICDKTVKSKYKCVRDKWDIAELDAEDKANEMHETVVAEISTKLEKWHKFE